MWEIVESFTKGKVTERCKDIIVDGPQFTILSDGTTDKHKTIIDGISGGEYVARVITTAYPLLLAKTLLRKNLFRININ